MLFERGCCTLPLVVVTLLHLIRYLPMEIDMARMYTFQDARRERYDSERIRQPKPTRKFYVVDCRGATAINPVSESKAHAYALEMDRDCPSYAPHKVVQVFA